MRLCVGWSHTEDTEYTESLRSVMVSRRRRRLSQKHAEQILCISVSSVCNDFWQKSITLRALCVFAWGGLTQKTRKTQNPCGVLWSHADGADFRRSMQSKFCVFLWFLCAILLSKKLWASTVSFLCFCVQNLNERDTFLSRVIFCNIRKNYWFRQVMCMEKCSVSSVHKYFRWSFTECYIKNEYLCKVIVIGLYTL